MYVTSFIIYRLLNLPLRIIQFTMIYAERPRMPSSGINNLISFMSWKQRQINMNGNKDKHHEKF